MRQINLKPTTLLKKFGFSLVEFAIVLGIIGLVLGSIWGYASQSFENVHREQATEDISVLTTGVRSYFGGLNGVPEYGVAAMMPKLISEGVVPNNLTRSPTTAASCAGNTALAGKYYCADNPWGKKETSTTIDPNGTLQVCDWSFNGTQTGCSAPDTPEAISATTTTQFFAVALKGLPNGSCIHMASYISSSLGPQGLVDVDINGTNIVTGLNHSLPVPTADLNAYCLAGSVNRVTFVYRFTLQSN